jgi:DNA polymerase III sliding clamp (beta) subunit (PCNA family)
MLGNEISNLLLSIANQLAPKERKMGFAIKQPDLEYVASLMKQVRGKRPTHVVLSYIHVTVSHDSVTFYATDLSLWCEIKITETEWLAPGQFLLPIYELHKFISKCKNKKAVVVRVEVDASEIVITLESVCRSEDRTLRLISQASHIPDISEMPLPDAMPLSELTHSVTMPAKEFLYGLSKTVFAVSQEETKQCLTTVNLRIGKKIDFAATDGHRLSHYWVDNNEFTGSGFSFNLPVNFRLLSQFCQGDIQINYYNAQDGKDRPKVQIVCGENSLVVGSYLIDSQYPSYESLIPNLSSAKWVMRVNRKQILNFLSATYKTEEKLDCVLLTHQDNSSLEISRGNKTNHEGNPFSATLPAIHSQHTEKDELALNAQYWIEALNACNSTNVSIYVFKGPLVIIIGDSQLRQLIMGIQIRE